VGGSQQDDLWGTGSFFRGGLDGKTDENPNTSEVRGGSEGASQKEGGGKKKGGRASANYELIRVKDNGSTSEEVKR